MENETTIPKGYKIPFLGLKKENESLKTQLENATISKQELQEKLELTHTQHTERVNELEQSINDKDALISEQKLLIKEKQTQINNKEVRKMASAYEDQEDIYKNDISEWKTYLSANVGILLIATLTSIYFATQKPWYERFEYYLVDFILISVIWFCGSQYSYYTKLKNDYSNRKTLAQTYHNLLMSLNETADEVENSITRETKRLFMDKATTVLCTPSVVETKEPILSKEVAKNIAEIAKAFGK